MANEPENHHVPEWIARRQAEKAEQARRDEEALQRQLAGSHRVANEGPGFWADLISQLKVNTQALPELGDELLGGASLLNDDLTKSPELHCHIQVNRSSVQHDPEFSHMNLWYQPGGVRIRCWYQNQKCPDIELRAGRNELVAVIDNESPKTAKQLADHIVEWMADRVRYVEQRRYRLPNL